MLQIADSTIRDTISSVFAAPEFNTSTPIRDFWNWLRDMAQRAWDFVLGLLGMAQRDPVVFWLVVVVGVLLAAAIIARAAQLWYAQRAARTARGMLFEGSLQSWHGTDPWRAAQELAAGGNFTEAAHALYQALLEAAARRGEIRLHSSKTVGDYGRELRARSSSLLSSFRSFAHSYETVIYGIGSCDRQRYDRLRALAAPVIQPDG
ncbi:MAG: DUF4129 domain-containing protein [Gemmatimonadaceae bacterium]